MTLSTIEKAYYTATRKRAQNFLARRRAKYEAECALWLAEIAKCNEALGDGSINLTTPQEIAEQNKAAALPDNRIDDLPGMLKKAKAT